MDKNWFEKMIKGEVPIVASFKGDSSEVEDEATLFAMELLMPRELVLREYKKLVIPVSDSLARTFQVPKEMMCKQLDSMGLTYI